MVQRWLYFFFSFFLIAGCATKSFIHDRWSGDKRVPVPKEEGASSSQERESLVSERNEEYLWFVTNEPTKLAIFEQRGRYLASLPKGERDRRSFFYGGNMIGKNKEEVLKRWGLPKNRDIVGYVWSRNERWFYHEGRRKQVLYFKRGVVYGWEDLP